MMKVVNSTFTDDFLRSFEGLELPDELSARFEVMERLSISDIAETFLLSEKDTGKMYVLKCYDKNEMKSGTGSESREAGLLRGLCHKGIPRFETEAADADTFYVVREYVSGVALSQYLNERAAGEGFVLRLISDLCEILTYLHGQPAPVIHRDIKPSNIILNSEDGGITLIDFDISRRYSKEASHDTFTAGTYAYAAPEQFGYGQTDGRSDIFSVGVLMRFMLTGDVKGTIKKKGLARIAARCQEFDPDNRYKSARALKRAIAKYKNRVERTIITAGLCVTAVCLSVAAYFYILQNTGVLYYFAEKIYEEEPHVFADPFVEQAARAVLAKPADEPITKSELSAITGLYFYGKYAAPDLKSRMEYAEQSFFEYGTLTDLSDVEYMFNLQEVYIAMQPITDLSPLSERVLLNHVEFNLLPNLTDISPLADCMGLNSIFLSLTSVTDVSPLTASSSLTSLRIAANDIDYSSIQAISSLKTLYLGHAVLENLSELGYQPYIQELILDNVTLTHIQGLENFPALVVLNLASNPSITDFTALNSHPTVRRVFIHPNMEANYRACVTRDDISMFTRKEFWDTP